MISWLLHILRRILTHLASGWARLVRKGMAASTNDRSEPGHAPKHARTQSGDRQIPAPPAAPAPQATLAVSGPPGTLAVSRPPGPLAASGPADPNERLRQASREIRDLADKFLIEGGRVIVRASIPTKL